MLHLHATRHVLVALAAGILLALSTVPAGTAAGGVVQLSGVATPDVDHQCDDTGGAFVFSGDLTGCYFVDTSVVRHASAGGNFVFSGTETFDVCLHGDCGKLHTVYTFSAKFLADGSEAHGRCHHPIVAGDGAFAGATGVVNMHDLPDGSATYSGHVTY